jgi:putative hydrolase of the HAD superfamily
MIKAILFDCFGVLVGKGFGDIYAIAGGDPVKDESFLDDILSKSNSGEITSDDFGLAIAERLNISITEYRKIVDHEEKPNLPLFQYIHDELKPEYKIAMVSNVNHGVIERKIPNNLRELFDVEILSAEVGYLKPNPMIFKIATQKLNVRYEEAVFVDDIERFTLAASGLGLRTILYKDLGHFKIELGKQLQSR